METHHQLNDAELEKSFQKGMLDPALFNHEAHLRIAWIHIQHYGIDMAINQVCTQLAAFTERVGAADKYNKTLTIAAIKAVNHFMSQSDATNFNEFIDQNPRLKYHFKELMTQHYTIDIFNSSLAKTKFIEPDLLPFG